MRDVHIPYALVVDDNAGKRRLEEHVLEQPATEVNETNPKRQKVDEFDTDNEELAILELGADYITILLHTLEEMSALKQVELASGNPGSGPNGSGAPQPAALTGAWKSAPRGVAHLLLFLTLYQLLACELFDMLPEAVKSIELNINHNGVGEIVYSNVDDARAYMHSRVSNERRLR
jgi:hypothetical protein